MNRVRNESGNALLIVLIMITFFSILFAAFMATSVTTVKQARRSEETSQSVALAEMGVSYMHALLNNLYETNKPIVDQEIMEQIESDIPERTSEEYTELAISKIKHKIEEGLIEEFSFTTDLEEDAYKKEVSPGSSFLIKEIAISDGAKSFTIEFKSDGIENGELTKTVSSGVEIGANADDEEERDVNIDLGLSKLVPSFENIQKPDEWCSPLKDCDTILIDSEESLGDLLGGLLGGLFGGLNDLIKSLNKLINELSGNKDLSNKTIYSTEDLTIGGSPNKRNNIKLHSVNNLFINNNFNSSKNLLLETQGNATFEKKFIAGDDKLSDEQSKILVQNNMEVKNNNKLELINNTLAYIGGTLTTSGKFKIADDSLAYVNNLIAHRQISLTGSTLLFVNEHATLLDTLEIGTACKMCVKGYLDVSNINNITLNLDGDIGLIVKEGIRENGIPKTINKDGIATGTKSFEELCVPRPPYNWENQSISFIEYHY